MLAGERQTLILEAVRGRGFVRVGELTELLGVSDMTVRRDLTELAERGLVEKVHGGATVLMHAHTEDPGLETRLHRQLREKRAIAQSARTLVRPGQVIGLAAGTTTLQLAHALEEIPNLTVVTNSLQIAGALRRNRRSDLTLVLTGGMLLSGDILVGPLAVAAAATIHLDLLFLGVHGMTEDEGFTSPDLLETEIDRTFIASTDVVALVADHTKWGVRGLSPVASLSEADVLVTDSGLPDTARDVLEREVGQLLVAPVEDRRRRAKITGPRSA